jgi:septal ring factor EnvC (AmiA/AmiB activator)
MRSLAVAVGCLLLLGGVALVAIADQERLESIAAVKAEIVRVERALDESRGENRELAEKLTALRSQLAEQDAEIADTTGFLQ